ncbi:phosphoglucosamine mutase [Carboxydothermus hydrogenoformans]|uniref:Phosphoglucosamine mutase n=1 Tax=Carboxydothermus hydrogenoformans (strain ATCC BAA-161 / DSM 6008 / Z-2901) TaxID=246194 RepID=GLMM_CARHZ|nr:phosphoglucosamine mutase [Carboxydothermus hydrogenoformans]Q3AAK3.1 RecName: Full=Phosphoglucosamine mutase [Carboxydothermus hydrogenoformans Z-2901]ABB14038.1 phosphoglucosamine mutase [Carboxydothermus hydrogenoformans Z-2901]
MGKLFGTDGVRGVANRDLTPELAYKLGRAAAYVLKKKYNGQGIVVGKDTRISGDMLETALAAGILSVGLNVLRVGVMPTPAIAYLTRELKATAGAVISASHNPMEDNGIKFFSGSGFKLPDEVEEEIEKYVLGEKEIPIRPIGAEIGRVREISDAVLLYKSFAKNTVELPFSGLRVVVDCANGAASYVAPKIYEELGAEVIPIFNTPDGTNINANCGSTHPEALMRAVVEEGAHLGLAHDGDADRVLAVDEKGNLVDGDQIMVIIGKYLKKKGLLKNNRIVVTVMSNLGLKKAFAREGIEVLETKVGDRYVLEEMLKNGAIIGGEQSGHIILLDHNTTGDGIITALQLMQVIVAEGKKLSELAQEMPKFPQVLKNVRVLDKEKIMASEELAKAIARGEKKLGEGRILVRPSGTEPLIRVMAEGADAKLTEEVVDEIIAVIEKL